MRQIVQLAPHARTGLLVVGALMLGLLAMACGLAGTSTTSMSAALPRWACPSVTPLPTIQLDDGTEPNPLGTPVPKRRDTAPYEREYGPPGPTPTPYIREGTTFFLGQIVNLAGGIDVQVDVSATGTLSGTQRLYLVRTTWWHPAAPLALEPARQILISAVKRPDGRMLGGVWGWTFQAAQLAALPAATGVLTSVAAPGTTALTLPILAPDGIVQTVDLRLDQPGANVNSLGGFRVQFVADHEPHCDQPGTLGAVYADAAQLAAGVAAPPGSDAVIASALRQLGRQYCWGGKGYTPCSGQDVTPPCQSYPCFDCSGLTWFAYHENGITIGQGTANQQNYPAVPLDQVQPGDLLLFSDINAQGRGARITHVGMYVGDLDGDGMGDMVHAANYPTGVILTKNIFSNRYYKQRLVIITRPPRGGGR